MCKDFRMTAETCLVKDLLLSPEENFSDLGSQITTDLMKSISISLFGYFPDLPCLAGFCKDELRQPSTLLRLFSHCDRTGYRIHSETVQAYHKVFLHF